MPEVQEGEERVFMKMTGVLMDLLVDMAPEVDGPHVAFENGRKDFPNTENPTAPWLPPEEMIDRSFLMPPAEDGSQVRAMVWSAAETQVSETDEDNPREGLACLRNST